MASNIKSEKFNEYIGKTINDTYVLESFIGEGAMGLVFLANDKSLERKVAIKIIKKETLGKTPSEMRDTIKRFKDEAKNIAKIMHQNVVKVYYVGTYEDVPFIAMEFIEGKKLSDILIKNRPINWIKCLKLVYYIANGLDYCHSKHVIHRDIKPANLMLEELTGTIKIVDYGLSKYVGIKTSESITHRGVLVGTPRYLAPELWNDNKNISAKCDVYSLGVVLYEMLTGGHFPYNINPDENEFLALLKLYTGGPLKSIFVKDVVNNFKNEYIENLLVEMLRKDPEKRCSLKTVMDLIKHIFEKYEIEDHLYSPISMENFGAEPCINHKQADKIQEVDELMKMDKQMVISEIAYISEKNSAFEEIHSSEEYQIARKNHIEDSVYKKFKMFATMIYLSAAAIISILFLLIYLK